MNFDEVIKLIKAVSDSSLKTFQYEVGDTKIFLETGSGVTYKNVIDNEVSTMMTSNENMNKPEINNKDCFIITSPIVGTFYTSKSEGSSPFVKIGDQVKKGQVIGIIDAMKLMNEIESNYDGIVEEIYVKNEQIVEYNQPILKLKSN